MNVSHSNMLSAQMSVMEEIEGGKTMNMPFFDELTQGILDPQKVLEASSGEVREPVAWGLRSLKPLRDGLYDERIFGPIDDFTCMCGKYRGRQYEGKTCERCHVTLLPSSVRSTRMAHIVLSVPVIPPCYLQGTPSRLSRFLGIDPQLLKELAYYQKWIVTDPGEPKAAKRRKTGDIITTRSHLSHLKKTDCNGYHAVSGGEAVQLLTARLLSTVNTKGQENPDGKTNLQMEYEALQDADPTEENTARKEVLASVIRGELDPAHMVITIFPVVPPSYRPTGSILASQYLHFAAINFPDSSCFRKYPETESDRNRRKDPVRQIREKEILQRYMNHLLREMAIRSGL